MVPTAKDGGRKKQITGHYQLNEKKGMLRDVAERMQKEKGLEGIPSDSVAIRHCIQFSYDNYAKD
jgi:hypothetical protein